MKRVMTVAGLLIPISILAVLTSVPLEQGQGRVAVAGQSAVDDEDDGDEHEILSRIRTGFEIAPVPLNLQGKNRALVGLGSYIVNAVQGCNGCHTDAGSAYVSGGNPFLGEPEQIDPEKYLVGGTVFGPFVSRNLRPNATTGLPARLTFEEFQTVMRTGADLKQRPPHVPGPGPEDDLIQVMPWPELRNMTDLDIRAIYEYLSALPPR
jgi:hypothetical protein